MTRKNRSTLAAVLGTVVACGVFAGPLAAQEFPAFGSISLRGGFAYLDDGPRATGFVLDFGLGQIGETKLTPVIGASYWHTNRLGYLKAPGGYVGLRYEPLLGARLTPYVQAKALGQDLSARGGGAARDAEWSGFAVGAGLAGGLALALDENQHVRLMLEGERVFIDVFNYWGARLGFSLSTGVSHKPVVAVAPVPPPVDTEALQLAEKAAADAKTEARAATEAKNAAESRASKAERELRDALNALGRLMRDVVTVEETSRGVVITLGKGLFAFDQHTLSPRAGDEVARIAAVLRYFEGHRILVEGHTDAIGPERYNQGLSERRAKSVADALTKHGIPESRMELSGHGLHNPVADNKDRQGRALNRRVEVVIVGAKLPGN